MTRRPYVYVRPEARADVDDSASFIAGHNLDAGLRFLAAFDQALTTLADYPNIGTPYEVTSAKLHGLRYWHVPRFESWLVFYLPREDSIEIVRVLHGARDIPRLFEDER